MPNTHKWPPPCRTQRALIAARDLYASAPSHAAYPQSPAPGTYCVISALVGNYLGAIDVLREAAGDVSLVDFNARHTTEEVLAMFDRAIEAAGAAFSARVEAWECPQCAHHNIECAQLCHGCAWDSSYP